MIFMLAEYRSDGSVLDLSTFGSLQDLLEYSEAADINDGILSAFDTSGNVYNFSEGPGKGAYRLSLSEPDFKRVEKMVRDYMESYGAVYDDSVSLEVNVRKSL